MAPPLLDEVAVVGARIVPVGHEIVVDVPAAVELAGQVVLGLERSHPRCRSGVELCLGCMISETGGVVTSLGGFHTARDRARPEGLWYMRHEQVLERWPILAEDWARQIEERRLEPLRNRDIAYLHGAGR